MNTKVHTLPTHTRKTCDLFRLLAGYDQIGLAPGEIAKALGVGASWVSVNLPALADYGFCERVAGTPRWRLGVAFVRIASTVFMANTDAQDALKQRLHYITTAL